MMRWAVSAVLLLMLAAPAWAGFDEGVAAYNRRDYATAFREFRPLAEQGNASAQANLGFMHAKGQGVVQDYAAAVRLYRKAAAQGNATAQNNLGFMYENGEGVAQDYAAAVRWYRKAAMQGNARAQGNLGLMYDNGQGVAQDYAEAMGWYRKAAAQGNASAQNNLGVMYDKGLGMAQDYAAAVRLYRKAAAQGYATAQYNLGIMYDNGRGVLQDYAAAVRLYRKAAARGIAEAQYNLGVMYGKGQGVLQDYVQAHKWYNLAAARGDKKAIKNRDIIAKRMTHAQVAKAQRLARAWRPKQPAAVSRPTPQVEPTGPDPVLARQRIARIQRQLAVLGYTPGPADGVLGPKTRAAIRDFKKREGLRGTGTISGPFEAALSSASGGIDRASSPPSRPLKKVSTGSGFYVSDLALLKGPPGANRAIVRFRQGRGIRPGDDIVVVGYPLRGLLASEVNVTTGTVSALAGPGDDRRFFQLTAPVQPGNSGGPVLDRAGNAVGVVVSRLDALKLASATGILPQNVNFAIGAGTVRAFLDANSVPYETAPSINKIDTADVAARARGFTVLIQCWK